MFFVFLNLCMLLILATCIDSTLMTITGDLQSTTFMAETTSTNISRSNTSLSSNSAICKNLNVMEDINIYKISGTWYEFARRGYGTLIQNVQCLQMNITYMNGTAFVTQTYAANMNSIHDHMSFEYILQYNTTNVSDYSILSTTSIYLPVPTFKILDTDYVNYLIVCSYLPEWEQSAAAFAYFRNINTADNEVFFFVREAAKKYADFQEMNLVYQGECCRSKTNSINSPIAKTLLILLTSLALARH